MTHLALFEPDIPQNAAAILRTSACLGVDVDIIEPAGFLFGDRQFRRVGLDYLDLVAMHRFPDWETFRKTRANSRLVLLSTRAETSYVHFAFSDRDVLILGRESAGVPPWLHDAVDARVRVPLVSGRRSLNVAVAAAMVLGEALRQTGRLPPE